MEIIVPRTISGFQNIYCLHDDIKFCFTTLLGWDYATGKVLSGAQAQQLLAQSKGQAINEAYYPKKNGEVLVYGNAVSKGKKPQTNLLLELYLNRDKKTLFHKKTHVFGQRYWQMHEDKTWEITNPEKFEKMPVSIEHAFGGMGFVNSEGKAKKDLYRPNVFGKGFDAKARATQYYEQLHAEHQHKGYGPIEDEFFKAFLPELENPRALIENIDDEVEPISLGPFHPSAPFIAENFGTINKKWEKNPIRFPKDFDESYFNVAQSNQRIKGHFQPEDTLVIKGMNEEGDMHFKVPDYRFRHLYGKLTSDDKKNDPSDLNFDDRAVHLDTIHAFPNQNIAIFAYRSSISLRSIDFNNELGAILGAYENGADKPRAVDHYANYYVQLSEPDNGILILADYNLKPERSSEELSEIELSQSQEDEKMIDEYDGAFQKNKDVLLSTLSSESKKNFAQISDGMADVSLDSTSTKIKNSMEGVFGSPAMQNPFSLKPLAHLVPRPPSLGELTSGKFNFESFLDKMKASKAQVSKGTSDLSKTVQEVKADIQKEKGFSLDQEAKKLSTNYLDFRVETPLDENTFMMHWNPDPNQPLEIPADTSSPKNFLEGLYTFQKTTNMSPKLLEEDALYLGKRLVERAENKRNLCKFNMSNAILENATFKKVVLLQAFSENTVFKNMHFVQCNFQDAVLRGSRFSQCTFKQCLFPVVNFSETQIFDSAFEDCLFNKNAPIDFRCERVKFVKCTFTKLILQETAFKNCAFESCFFEEVIASSSDFDKSSFANSHFKSTNFMQSSMNQTFWSHVHADTLGLFGVVAQGSFWNNAVLKTFMVTSEENDFSGSSFSKANIDEKSSFYGTNLSYCDFSFAKVSGVNFEHTNLRYVIFQQAFAKAAKFGHALTEGIDFSGSNLAYADLKNLLFEHANLDRVSLYGANMALTTVNEDTSSMNDADLRAIKNWDQEDEEEQQEV